MTGNSEIDFSGQVAIVTGGTRGLGRLIAERLAARGALVTVCGRTAPDALARPVGLPPPLALPPGVTFRAADVRDPDAARALADAVMAEHGRIDVLVNNAGGSPQAAAATASPRFFDSIVRLNLHSAMYMAQAVFAHMQPAKSGSIVNIASVAGIRPSPMTAAYGAAKAGLLNLTQSLAQEWGPDGVRVNAIIAGLMQTENAAATYGDAAAQDAVAHSLPLQRMGTGADIADAVLWLCSDLATWVSGARINVDGGGERPHFLDLVKGE